MKKLIPLLFLFLLLPFISCDSKKQSLIDSQKLINKKLTGMVDSLHRISDSETFYRIKTDIKVLQERFDSLGREIDELKKK